MLVRQRCAEGFNSVVKGLITNYSTMYVYHHLGKRDSVRLNAYFRSREAGKSTGVGGLVAQHSVLHTHLCAVRRESGARYVTSE
jgi:hypothetical protein